VKKQITPVNRSVEFDTKVEMLFEDLTERRELYCFTETACVANACVCVNLCAEHK
jgi:hypothetical protein